MNRRSPELYQGASFTDNESPKKREFIVTQPLSRALFTPEQERLINVIQAGQDQIIAAEGEKVILPVGTHLRVIHSGIHNLVEIISCSDESLVGRKFPASAQTISTLQLD